MRRMLARREVEALQGFPAGRVFLPAGVSDKMCAVMLGNAFTVPVVGRVCLALLRTVGLVAGSVEGYRARRLLVAEPPAAGTGARWG